MATAARLVPAEPGLELITSGSAQAKEPLDLGDTPVGHRRIIMIAGGRFEGPRLNADVVPGGADWQIVHEGGWATLLARYTLRTDDGVLISVVSSGVRHGPPDVLARIFTEHVDPREYYFRTAVSFETAEGTSYSWLNHIVAVSSGARSRDTVALSYYAVT